MKSMPILSEAKELHRSLTKQGNPIDFQGEVNLSRLLLNSFHVGHYFYMIYFLPDQRVEHCSDGLRDILLIDPDQFSLEYVVDNIHPDDLPNFMRFEKSIIQLLQTFPPVQLTSYKAVYDYRVRCADGTYKRLLHQLMPLQNHDDGAVIRSFGIFTDISHLKSSTRMQLNVIGMNGAPSFYDVKEDGTYTSSESPLGEREKQVLAAMAEGLTSMEIAENLKITKNTVDSHRHNILAKTESKTSVEALGKALTGHWI